MVLKIWFEIYMYACLGVFVQTCDSSGYGYHTDRYCGRRSSSALSFLLPCVYRTKGYNQKPSAAHSNELAPGLDLRGNPAFAVFPQATIGHFFCEAVDEELSRSRVVQQRQPKVDSVPNNRY
jgi:hypothetical protein